MNVCVRERERERRIRTRTGQPLYRTLTPYSLKVHMVIWFFVANEHLPAGIIKLNTARRKQLNPTRINIYSTRTRVKGCKIRDVSISIK